MSQIDFTEKEQVFYKKYIGSFDTPKKLNRSIKTLPAATIDEIEAGNITSEAIQAINKIVPVFTYKTCLTIHGNLPAVNIQRIGDYKNVIQNKNGSLEIRYSAIDNAAKKQIQNYIGYGGAWTSRENSLSGIYFTKSKTADDKQKAIQLYNELKEEAESFNVDGLKASVSVGAYNVWGRYYLVLYIYPLIITGQPLTITAAITRDSEANILERYNAREEAERIKDQQYKAAAARQHQERAAATAILSAQYKPERIQPSAGKVYVSVTPLNSINFGFRFLKVESKGAFNRLILSSYCSSTPSLEPDKFKPFRHGKQIALKDINYMETFLINQ